MFIRKEIKIIQDSGYFSLQPYCKKCYSHNLKYICKDCESTDIETNLSVTDNACLVSEVKQTQTEVNIHKCEYCGKEFEQTDNVLYFDGDDVGIGSKHDIIHEFSKEFIIKEYPYDICDECLGLIKEALQSQFDNVFKDDNINQLSKELLKNYKE